MKSLSIGQLANATAVKVPTIRFYEEIGLLPSPARTASDRRIYTATTVQRLSFIRHARQLGFPTEAIRTLLELSDHPDRSCEDANVVAREQLAAVDAKIGQLNALRVELAKMLETNCHGAAARCRIIEAVAGPT
jgi:DNA-binding transcriptional MerR regulator